jgi:light-regulated signal transduction histidine kinase (bacteriophytochrome)
MGKVNKQKEFINATHGLSFQKNRIEEQPFFLGANTRNKHFVANNYEQLKQKVVELTAQLQNANKDLDEFTYSISHDLRAPLRAINGYANIIKEDYASKLDTDGLSSLEAILKNASRMGELIGALLAFSRLGRNVVDVSEINMKSLVKSINLDKMVSNTSNVELTVNDLLPAKGQQALIEQVWAILISNALKFSKNNLKITIEIGSYANGNLVVYYVKDNGVGFDMQYYYKLFNVFQRLHTLDDFEGTGIGLAIVKKIVTNHNGTVWAESKLNEGSCFFFSLPGI